MAEVSIRGRILKVLSLPTNNRKPESGRGIDPWQDSESSVAFYPNHWSASVAEVSIRGRILKALRQSSTKSLTRRVAEVSIRGRILKVPASCQRENIHICGRGIDPWQDSESLASFRSVLNEQGGRGIDPWQDSESLHYFLPPCEKHRWQRYRSVAGF